MLHKEIFVTAQVARKNLSSIASPKMNIPGNKSVSQVLPFTSIGTTLPIIFMHCLGVFHLVTTWLIKGE